MKLIELQKHIQETVLNGRDIEGYLDKQIAMANEPCLDAFEKIKKHFKNSSITVSLRQQYGGSCFYTIEAHLDVITITLANLQTKNCMVHKQPVLLVFNAPESVLQMEVKQAVIYLLEQKVADLVEKLNITVDEAEVWVRSLKQRREVMERIQTRLSLIKGREV